MCKDKSTFILISKMYSEEREKWCFENKLEQHVLNKLREKERVKYDNEYQ